MGRKAALGERGNSHETSTIASFLYFNWRLKHQFGIEQCPMAARALDFGHRPQLSSGPGQQPIARTACRAFRFSGTNVDIQRRIEALGPLGK